MASSNPDSDASGPVRSPRFATTRWSVVLGAGKNPTSQSREALATLCETYWYPLYAYARRAGHGVEDTEDLIQGFLARLIERRDFQKADPARGKFRSYLLASLRHYISNERERREAQKRGGGAPHFSLDPGDAEDRYTLEAADNLTPERIYERRWALTLLEAALAQVADKFVREGKAKLFTTMKPYLTDPSPEAHYRDAASEVGMTEGAFKTAVHRLRRDYREALRREISHTVPPGRDTEREIEAELQYLMSALSP